MTREEFQIACQYLLDAMEIPHFKAYEIALVGRETRHHETKRIVRLKAPPAQVAMTAISLIRRVLLWTRDMGDVAPISINSWYRDLAYNAAVGGATNSIHPTGGASDINKRGLTPLQLALRIHRNHPDSEKLGIGLYRGFVHVDVRGFLGRPAPARWSKTNPNWWK